jgi:hypothetical protein
MMDISTIPVRRMHRQEWLTEVSHSHLLNGLAKKKLWILCRIVNLSALCWLRLVVIDLHL